MNSMLPITGPDNLTEQDLGRLYYAFAATYGHRAGAKAIDGFQASLAGNPQHVILVNGKVYTMRMLAHYMHYAYCCRFIDFDAVQTIVELGSGCGKQAEVK